MADFPRYPDSGGDMVRPEGEPAPPAIQNAVKLMYAGAAVSIIGLIIGLATAGNLKSEIRKARPHFTATQVNNSATFIVTATVISGLIGAALWLWMARANQRGRSWARIVSSVFFGISTLTTVSSFAQPSDALSRILTVAVWLVGLAAVILIWRPEASAYYKVSSGRPG